jgi:hypothetical protein
MKVFIVSNVQFFVPNIRNFKGRNPLPTVHEKLRFRSAADICDNEKQKNCIK